MTQLHTFPSGFAYRDDIGEVVVDHVLPLFRGTSSPALRMVANEDILFVEGWATVIDGKPRAADAVILSIDGRPIVFAALGEERTDVAGVHGEATLKSGFRGMLPLRGLEPGFHTASVSAVHRSARLCRASPEFRFLVVDAETAFPHTGNIELESVAPANDLDSARVGALSVTYGTRALVRGRVSAPHDAIGGVAILVNSAHVFEAFFDSTQALTQPVRFEASLASEFLGLGKHQLRALYVGTDGTPREISTSTIDLEVMGADL